MPNSPVVVITGVSSGIGRTAAEQFAGRGCRVFGSVRNPATAQAIPGVELIHLDIRDEASIRQSIEHVIAEAGRIDVLVNNAGTTLLGATEETAIDEAQALFDTNVFGVLRVTQAVLPQMRKQSAGRIVNVSSVLGFLPAPYMGLYRLPNMQWRVCPRPWITRCGASAFASRWSSLRSPRPAWTSTRHRPPCVSLPTTASGQPSPRPSR